MVAEDSRDEDRRYGRRLHLGGGETESRLETLLSVEWSEAPGECLPLLCPELTWGPFPLSSLPHPSSGPRSSCIVGGT